MKIITICLNIICDYLKYPMYPSANNENKIFETYEKIYIYNMNVNYVLLSDDTKTPGCDFFT